MGGSGGSSSNNPISPELRPLYKQTGQLLQELQPQIAGQFGEFFGNQVQNIPGFTQGQEDIRQYQRKRFEEGEILNPQEMAANNQLMQLVNSPVGSAPHTIAAMQAARDPVLNDLAASGLGNSDAIGTGLTGAYAPILAQEMALRAQAIPQLQQLGSTFANRQSQWLNEYGQTEEAARGIQETRGQAELNDVLRRQGLGSQFTTGILGNFPSTTGSTTKGGGK
jgi:hypothetical protein